MDFINSIIIEIDNADLRDSAYGTINTVARYLSILIGIFNGWKLKSGIKSFAATSFSVVIERMYSGYLALAILFIEDGFRFSGRANGVVIFPYIPLIALLFAKIFKKSYKEFWDVMMVPPLAMFAGARIACTVTGCCQGYPCSWGVYNGITDEILFPIQLLEFFVSVVILAYVFYREKKNNFVPDGMNVPIILISYGVLRFFLEFLHDNEKIVFGIASTQFHCLIMIVVGMIALFVLKKDGKTDI